MSVCDRGWDGRPDPVKEVRWSGGNDLVGDKSVGEGLCGPGWWYIPQRKTQTFSCNWLRHLPLRGRAGVSRRGPVAYIVAFEELSLDSSHALSQMFERRICSSSAGSHRSAAAAWLQNPRYFAAGHSASGVHQMAVYCDARKCSMLRKVASPDRRLAFQRKHWCVPRTAALWHGSQDTGCEINRVAPFSSRV
jgi:hypothetical protein